MLGRIGKAAWRSVGGLLAVIGAVLTASESVGWLAVQADWLQLTVFGLLFAAAGVWAHQTWVSVREREARLVSLNNAVEALTARLKEPSAPIDMRAKYRAVHLLDQLAARGGITIHGREWGREGRLLPIPALFWESNGIAFITAIGEGENYPITESRTTPASVKWVGLVISKGDLRVALRMVRAEPRLSALTEADLK